MEFRVFAVGDVVGDCGVRMISRHLPRIRRRVSADFTVVNGENAATVGLTRAQAEEMFAAGADVITLGNHAFGRREIADYLEDCPRILRPANLAPQLPGRGFLVAETKAGPVAILNLIGRCHMDYGPDNPFLLGENIAKKVEKEIKTRLFLVEMHGEATSEKLAMGYLLDGKASAVWGTHTHVPTADVQVLPGGTGYVTDLGMTGPKNGILGIRPELSVARFRGDLAGRYQPAPGPGKLEAVLFTLDTETGRCLRCERIDDYDSDSACR